MKDMGALRQALAEHLSRRGLEAVCAWPEQGRPKAGKAVCAVSLRGAQGGPPGFRDYLGERYDEDSGCWEELYGKRMELTFGLDLYGGSAGEVQQGLDTLAAALEGEGPGGLRLRSFAAGETLWEAEQRRYVCRAQAVFNVWSYAVSRDGGAFLDIEVKGETV